MNTEKKQSIDKDITKDCLFGWFDDACLLLMQCACGKKFKDYEEILGIYRDDPFECSCGRKLYFSNKITIYEITEETEDIDSNKKKEDSMKNKKLVEEIVQYFNSKKFQDTKEWDIVADHVDEIIESNKESLNVTKPIKVFSYRLTGGERIDGILKSVKDDIAEIEINGKIEQHIVSAFNVNLTDYLNTK